MRGAEFEQGGGERGGTWRESEREGEESGVRGAEWRKGSAR